MLAARSVAAAQPSDADFARRALGVRSCGARGNGRDLDTEAINAAIRIVSKAGGGVVRVPAGDYLCRTLHLRDGVRLHLDRGAVLRAAPPGAYDSVNPNPWARYQDYGHDHWRDSMICGIGVKNAAVTGPGLICGDGLSRGGWSKPFCRAPGAADKIIALKECRNVVLTDFRLVGTAHIGILATGARKLRIAGLVVDTGRDGIDIDCSQDVAIEDCVLNTPGDDSIAIKSSDALGYRLTTAEVRVRRCVVTGGYRAGTLIDGRRTPVNARQGMKARIKVGTESCWGFRDIRIESCAVWNALGIPLLAVDGGRLQNIAIRDIVMSNIQDAPLFLRLGARLDAPPGAAVGEFADVTIENLKCCGFGMPLTLSGIPGHRIADVALRDIELVEAQENIVSRGGGWMPVEDDHAPPRRLVPPEDAAAYPEDGMFGALPAGILFARHVERLRVEGLSLRRIRGGHARTTRPRAKGSPLFWLEDVEAARFSGIAVPANTPPPICRSDRHCNFEVAASANLARLPDWDAAARSRLRLTD